MRNLLAFFAAAFLTFAAVGWYLDWYEIRTGPAALAGHRTVNIDINGGKIVQDVNHGVQKGAQRIQDRFEKHSDTARSSDRPDPGPPLLPTQIPPAGRGTSDPGWHPPERP